MAKPWVHACSSARKFGGEPTDFEPIHTLYDLSKGTIADNRHRALTHTAWFTSYVLERVFGVVITLSTGKELSVREVGEQHILEDFGNRFIPSAQDYLCEMELRPWMTGAGEQPPSAARLGLAHAVDAPHPERSAWEHAQRSAARFGGDPQAYLPVHEFLDLSATAVGDARHRALTHHSWFVATILPRVFGPVLTVPGTDGVAVVDVGGQHVRDDFGGRYLPTAQDYLQEVEHRVWMVKGQGQPPSAARLFKSTSGPKLAMSFALRD
jgi:hypothetical protein